MKKHLTIITMAAIALFTACSSSDNNTTATAVQDEKMLFEFEGKRYIAEFREIENPKEDIADDMRRIRYL